MHHRYGHNYHYSRLGFRFLMEAVLFFLNYIYFLQFASAVTDRKQTAGAAVTVFFLLTAVAITS